MKYKQACKEFGNGSTRKGELAIARLAAKVAKKHGIGVAILPHINEEEPSDNWLNAIFQYRVNGKVDQTNAFKDAFEEVSDAFWKHGLALSYECSGDADGIVESYRVG